MALQGELEQAVMEVLWSHSGQLTVRQVYQTLSRRRELAYTTVLTVLDRLAKKGVVMRELEGRSWQYRPARTRVDEVAAEIALLLSGLSKAEQQLVVARLKR